MTAEYPQGDEPLIPMPALSLPALPQAGDESSVLRSDVTPSRKRCAARVLAVRAMSTAALSSSTGASIVRHCVRLAAGRPEGA